MADGVARSPSRLCSRDGKICCYGDALSTIFFLVFVHCFLLFVFRFSFLFLFFFLASRYVYLVRVPSSVQQPFATLSKYVFYTPQYVFFLLVSFVPHPISELFGFLFVYYFVSQLLFLGWRFFCCALVPGTPALNLPTLNLQRLVFLCLTVCDHRICISQRMKNQEGHWGYC